MKLPLKDCPGCKERREKITAFMQEMAARFRNPNAIVVAKPQFGVCRCTATEGSSLCPVHRSGE